MPTNEQYMQRCLELALKGAGNVAPNPMVGAVLVHDNRIIGEGWHQQYGGPHAEVNCIASVKPDDQSLIAASTMYVSLEPCAHFGKTPPCSNLIIEKQIPKVVIGCRDPFPEVNGKGVERLQSAGVEVVIPVLEKECRDLNKRFFTYNQEQRPYIILKWAQTADGFIGSTDHNRLLISNEFSNRLVHQWRSEEIAIMVGTNTALLDNPKLTNRYGNGPQPVRVVVDRTLRLPDTLQLFQPGLKTIILNDMKEGIVDHLHYVQLSKGGQPVQQIAAALHRENIQSVLIEGGAALLQSFIDAGLWDEVRIITNTQLQVQEGVKAPVMRGADLISEIELGTDLIQFFKKPFVEN